MHSKNYGAWNFIFDADTVRVIRVFTDPKDTSIDVDKHPLYVVFFKPVGRLLNDHLHDPAKSTLLITSFAGAAAILFVFLIFSKSLRLNSADALLFSILFGSSSSVWLFCSIAETFSFNLAAIVLLFYLQTASILPSFSWRFIRFNLGYILYSFVATGITFTNGVYSFLSYINFYRKQKTKWLRISIFVSIFLMIILLLIILCSHIQHKLYPEAFIFSGLKSFITIYRIEATYVTHTIGHLCNLPDTVVFFRTLFFDNIIAPMVVLKDVVAFNRDWNILGFNYKGGSFYNFTVLVYALFLIYSGVYIIQQKLFKEKDLQLAISFIVFNCMLHFFYRAVGIPFIYSIHLVFSVVFLLASCYKRSSFRLKRICLFILTIFTVINNYFFIKQTNYLLRTSNPHEVIKIK